MRNFIFTSLICFSSLLYSQSNDTLLLSQRNLALLDWDFQLADYYYSQISKRTKDSLGLKRKWVSNINFQPKISSVSDFKLSKPFVGFDYGFGLNPTPKWQIQQQWNSNGVNINYLIGRQTNYKFQNSYRASENWEFRANIHTMNIDANRVLYNQFTEIDTITNELSLAEQYDSTPAQSGKVKRGVYTSSLGLVKHLDQMKFGGFFGIRNEYLSDSIIIYETDSTDEFRSLNAYSKNYHQLSLFGEWRPNFYNSSLRLTGWLDMPFDGDIISLSPYFKTEILITPNTWVGGWVRHYSSSLEPIEIAADIQNFGLDQVYLKYGGSVNYQKSERWWIEFNIELQKRKIYGSKWNYSTLSLDFKFTYRLLQKDKKEK